VPFNVKSRSPQRLGESGTEVAIGEIDTAQAVRS
jgi:hypothetical protein